VNFQEWVEVVITQRFKTATALATALDMDLSSFSRAVKGGTLNLVNLLKLAHLSGTDPSLVLRLGKKAEEATLIESVYGRGGDQVTAAQRELLDVWSGIPLDLRPAFLVLLRHARDVAADVGGKTEGPSRPPTRLKPATTTRRRGGARRHGNDERRDDS
jgi:hypothetical protein